MPVCRLCRRLESSTGSLCRYCHDWATDRRVPSGLHHSGDYRRPRLQAYYDVLNEDGRFRVDLEQLLAALPPEFPEVRDPDLGPARMLSAQPQQMPPAVRASLEAFGERWRLPRDRGAFDLWLSLAYARSTGTLPTLMTAPGEPGDLPEELLHPRGGSDQVIYPLIPLPFDYDPTMHPPGWVREYASVVAAQVRQTIIDQAEMVEQRALERGWRRSCPRHRAPDEPRRVARRLYRRAVLGWSWQTIVRAEYPPDPPGSKGRAVATRAVRDSVEEWARILDVALP